MKKIIFLIVLVLVLVSCVNNSTAENINNDEIIEIVDTLKVDKIDIFEGSGVLTEFIKSEKIIDSTCIVRYSSKDNILYLTYNNNTYKRYDVMPEYKKDEIKNGYKYDEICFHSVDINGGLVNLNYILSICKYETYNKVTYHK